MNTFDIEIDRRHTGSLKWDALRERYGNPDLLPLWVADMDFATPPFIIDALRSRLDHPVLGYTVMPADYFPAIRDWLRALHGVEVPEEWISFIPGIVRGIGLAINCFLKPDEKVIIMPPVYHPFRLVPQFNGRGVVMNPLRPLPDGRYEIDFGNLQAVADEKCRMLILSNPHNPAGVAWSRETLSRLADFCASRGIIVISDEIHSEMMLKGKTHTPFYSVSDAARKCSITFAAPTKTFNMAGIVSSYSITPDPALRRKFHTFLEANELNDPPLFSPIAAIAAYRHGDPWRRSMLEYVEANIDYVCEFCREQLPGIKALKPDASFLVWLDCRDLGLGHDELISLIQDGAGLALNDGKMFGSGGEGFMRLNAGCPRALLTRALSALRTALLSAPRTNPDPALLSAPSSGPSGRTGSPSSQGSPG